MLPLLRVAVMSVIASRVYRAAAHVLLRTVEKPEKLIAVSYWFSYSFKGGQNGRVMPQDALRQSSLSSLMGRLVLIVQRQWVIAHLVTAALEARGARVLRTRDVRGALALAET